VIRIPLYVALLIFISLSATAQDPRATFEIIGNKKKVLKEGEIFEAMIRLWPWTNPKINEFKELEGKEFANYFFLANILSVNYSENNEEVLEIHGLFVLKKKPAVNYYLWAWQNINIPVEIKQVEVEGIKQIPENLVWEKQDITRKWNLGPKLLVMVLLLTALGFLFWGQIEKIFKNKTKSKYLYNDRKKWNELFRNARERKDYEEIYRQRVKWGKLVNLKISPTQSFFETLNRYQYKKSWTDTENLDVQIAFEQIKNTFGS
jgi:hypothetical protein